MLKNYYNYKRDMEEIEFLSGSSWTSSLPHPLVDCWGSSRTTIEGTGTPYYHYFCNTAPITAGSETIAGMTNLSTMLMFGTSDTAVQNMDYSLGSAIESGLTVAGNSVAKSYNDATGKLVYTITKTCSNTSGNLMVIKEVGLFFNIYNHPIMFERKVLSTPRTIASGETFTVTMTLEF